ncbi:hypothetical protein ACHQM5_025847 [Ranunculus cassubicifolius]
MSSSFRSHRSSENEFETPLNSIHLPPLRSPLNTIPDPSQYPTKEQLFHSRTPNRPNNVRGGGGGKSELKSPARRTSAGRRPPSIPEQPELLPYFELVQDPSFWTDHNVQVLVRMRPISSMERALQGNLTCLKQENAQTLSWLGHPETRFTFDHIACEMISQEKLFKVAGLPMVENCMSGYNSCMFAYGQTGSGKTYTMMGDIHVIDGKLSDDCGITPRIFEYLFTRIRTEEEHGRDEKLRYNCKCSFLEIYNEQITDLLEPSSTNLQLREELGKGVYVENLTEYEVNTVKDVIQLLLKGAANRKIAATNMNSESSRSHSVFTCVIESRRDIDSVTHLRFGRLNLVDLAGSERQKSSGAEGERLKEAANINKSLSTLGLVIMTLVDVAHGKHRHVPYRDSRLTFLLQDSLGGNSKTAIIANISPSICASNETLSTLKFAQRAKLIQNNAKVNEDAPGDVMALQRQIQQLKDQLTFLLKHQSVEKSLAICSPKPVQFQSEELDENFVSNIEEKTSDHPRNRSFPSETMRRIEATLAGALRREKIAETSVRNLQAEIEQMTRLVHQREEDAQRTKMILRLCEEKIKRLELLSEGFVSGDKYLMEENKSLSEEIQLLQEKIERNPELTQFALENKRLIEQLRMFQDFYEQGEREILMAEVSKLRDQEQDNEAAREMEECQRNLYNCLEINAKLTAQIDQLQRELNTYTACKRPAFVPHSQIELASIRIEPKDTVFTRNDKKANDAFALQPHDPSRDLIDAKALIKAMEQEQLRLIEEMNTLQKENSDYVKLFEKKNSEALLEFGNNFSKSRKADDPGNGNAGLSMEGLREITSFTLAAKLDGMNKDLEQARIMNKKYLDDQASQLLHQSEFEEICQQVEVETTKVILHLQEELAELKEELQDQMISMTEENSRLRNTIGAREDDIRTLSEEWEKTTVELTSFLLDGYKSLEDASEKVGSIASSFPERKAWINEHVERAANSFLEKERTIAKLEKSLEDAQKMGLEMMLKFNSLKGATLAITEIQQQEKNESSRELIQLQTLLCQKMAKIAELEKTLTNMENQVFKANRHGDVGEEEYFENENGLGVNIQERSSEIAVQATVPQFELRSQEGEARCSTTEVKHPKPGDPTFGGDERLTMASSFFSRFEEAQSMVQEADDMLNALLKANENAKHVSRRWKEAGEELLVERVQLIEEVQQLQSSIRLKDGQYNSMQDHTRSSFAEVELLLSSLEDSFLQMQRDVEESFKMVYSDIFSLRRDLMGFVFSSRSLLENLWAEIMENGFASFVLYQCYAEKLTEKISISKLESDVFQITGKNRALMINNAVDGCMSVGRGTVLSKTTNNTEYQIENLQRNTQNIGSTRKVQTSSLRVSDSEEDRIFQNPIDLISENSSLKEELVHKDVVLKGLLFDISLLQESTSSTKDYRDETKQMFEALSMARHELRMNIIQLDEALVQHDRLEALVAEYEAALCISNSEHQQAKETIETLSTRNSELLVLLDNLYAEKANVEEKLEEHKEVINCLEKELFHISSSVEEKGLPSLEDELKRLTVQRDHLQEEVVSLTDRLQMASALADENEAVATEARQESEASKVYAEQKEEEAKILEHCVEELESTINVLEKKVSDMSAEVDRHYRMRDSLEVELQALKLRMLTVENSTENMDSESSNFGQKEYQLSRELIERTQELEGLRKQLRDLEEERANQAKEMKDCREYISELVLHSEAQASQYQQKYKTLEAMVREVNSDPLASHSVAPTMDKTEKFSMRTRGSSSPFRCIASLVQQMKQEKDQEMSAAMLKIQELEALASSRQKEVCMLNARLAAAENMTHDVIRDLLGVKLDMTNYANLIDQQEVQTMLQDAQQQTDKFMAKEQETIELRKKVHDLTEEIQSCIEEINQKEAEILAAQLMVEQLKQRDQMLTARNEILKMDNTKLKRKIAEVDDTLKKQRPMKMKARYEEDELRKRLTNTDKLLSRVSDEQGWYGKACDTRDPHYRQEQWLRNKRHQVSRKISTVGNKQPYVSDSPLIICI